MPSGLLTYNAFDYAPVNDTLPLEQLDAAAQNTSKINLIGADPSVIYKNVNFQFLIASIDTDVVMRIQGSLNGTNWYNADRDEIDFTYTANGTYSVLYEGKGEILFIRVLMVSETGGTAVTVDVTVKFF